MSKTISIGFGVFALILTGLLIIPRFVDLNKWKPEIQSLASSALKRDVKIDGDISLIILPYPGVILSNVKIDNAKGSIDPHIITVEEITLTTAILPLIMKTLEFSQVSLISPKISLEVDKDGKKNWAFLEEYLLNLPVQESQTRLGSWAVSPTIPRINIQKGDLSYQEGDQIYTVSDFQTSLKSNSVQGPYRIEGQMSVNDKDLEFKTDIGEFMKNKPVNFDTSIYFGNRSLQIIGKYLPDHKEFEGQLASKMNPGDLFGDLSPIQSDMTVTSLVHASVDKVVLSKLVITHKDLNINGQALLDIGKQANVNIKLDGMPGQTSFSLQGPFTKLTQMQGRLGLLSANIRAFLAWIDPQLEIPEELKTFSLETNYAFKDETLKLSDLALMLGNNKISGDLEYKQPSLKLNLLTPDLSGWLSFLKPDSPYANISQASFSGNIQFAETIKLQTNLSFAKGHLKTTGQFTPKDMSYDLTVDASYPNFNEFLAALGFKNRLSMGSFNGKTRITGDAMKLSFSDLESSIKPAREAVLIKGQGAIDFTKERSNFIADLTVGRLSLPELLASKSGPRIQLASLNQTASGWSKEDLGLSCFNSFDADIKLNIAKLIVSEMTFEKAKLPITIANGTLKSEGFTGSLNGGAFDGQLSLNTKSEPSGQLKLNVKGTKINALNAPVDFNCDLDFKGGNLNDLITHLNGTINANASNVSISGFDAAAMEKQISSNQFIDVVKILEGKPSGSTKFDQITARGLINKGIIAIDQLNLEGPNLSGKGLGTINLNSQALDMTTIVAFKNIQAAPPFKVMLSGAMYNPQREVDATSLTAYIVAISGRKVLEKTLNAPNKILDKAGLINDGAKALLNGLH